MVLPPANLLGYAIYLLTIFLPGIGLGELLNIWPRGSTLMERLAYSFGIGLAIDTVVFLILTSGLNVGGFVLKGISMNSIYLLLAIGTAFLLLSMLIRRRFNFPTKPNKVDVILLFVMFVIAIIELLHFSKYPIFPEYQSGDFGNHVKFVQWLTSGAETSIPRGILYFAVHYQLASALLLVGGEAFVTLRWTMALLVVLSPMLFYLAAKAIFGKRQPALVVAGLCAFSATVWFVGVFNSGLYPNFFGILAVLFLLVATVDVASSARSLRAWIIFILSLVMTYFAHYTVITILPALLILPLFQYFKDKKKVIGYLAPAVVAILPGIVGLAFFPNLLQTLISLAVSGGGSLIGSTTLSSAFQALPVLSNLALLVNDDVELFFLILFSFVCLYKSLQIRNILVLVPLVWMLALFVAAPLNISSWRFSYEAVIPLILMAGGGISMLLPRLNRGSPRKRARNNFITFLVLIILLTPFVIGSWGTTAVADALTNTSASKQAQEDVYSAMVWLKANTPANSHYLSATDWRFTFSDVIIGRTTAYPSLIGCFTDTREVQLAALQGNFTYIIVTKGVTCSIPPDPSLFLWNTLKPSSNLTLVYSNEDVKVFKIG
jgi:hypothetical protein